MDQLVTAGRLGMCVSWLELSGDSKSLVSFVPMSAAVPATTTAYAAAPTMGYGSTYGASYAAPTMGYGATYGAPMTSYAGPAYAVQNPKYI